MRHQSSLALCFLFSLPSVCHAQPFEVDSMSFHAGGTTGDSTSEFSLSLTFGMSLASQEVIGNDFSVSYGLWNAIGIQSLCPADFTGDGTVNFFDVSLFLAAFDAMDPSADFNNDGSFNFFDVSAFLKAFAAGC
jgi:hypothetical protein